MILNILLFRAATCNTCSEEARDYSDISVLNFYIWDMRNVFTAFAILFGFIVAAQSLQELNADSKIAYENKDYARLLSLTQEMNELRPSHPGYVYNLACAYALTGENEKAIEVLKISVLMNSKSEFESDSDLSSIKTSKSYPSLLKLKSDLQKTVKNSGKIITLSEKALHPEGLIYLTKTKQWLATSIRKGKIVTFDIRTGMCADWLATAGMLSVFAMKADKEEKYLYVSTAAMPELETFSKEIGGRGEVLKVDIATREIVRRFSLDGNHVFGDMAIAKNGEIYVSDSGNPSIYKIANDEMSEWLNLETEAFNLQGITFNGKQDRIYIADYLKGILQIPIADPTKRDWLNFPEGSVAKGIDGLLWHRNTLVAVHNGVKPIRMIQYNLDTSGKQIDGFKILDHNRPEFDEPAMGIIVDGEFYFFANNPWKGYDRNYDLDESKFENPILFKYKL